MVGVGYGKGVTLADESVRWRSREDVQSQSSGALQLLDARDEPEHNAATIPGAISLAQTDLMFRSSHLQDRLDTLVAGTDELVLFANTGGPNTGMTAGRDAWVMAYLHELGVPFERMARLEGGFHGWRDAGLSVTSAGGSAADAAGSLSELLQQQGLSHLHDALESESLATLAAHLDEAGRPALLRRLKELGVSALAERQALAGALGKARRAGSV